MTYDVKEEVRILVVYYSQTKNLEFLCVCEHDI